MTSDTLLALRLQHQQLLKHDFAKPRDVVAWMGAMQAQDYNGVRWALGLRTPAATIETVQKSIDRGEIVRTHVMRPTWHLIAESDARWMLDLSAAHIKSSTVARLRDLELTPAILKKSLKILEKSLANGEHLTRDELLACLQKQKISTADQRAAHILLYAEIEKVICSGAMKGKKNTYASFDQRVSAGKILSRDQALMEIAVRYFQSHGPATLQDFINWSALPVADARKAVHLTGNRLVSETIQSITYIFEDRSGSFPSDTSGVWLLPAFDEYLIGYKDRSASLQTKNKSAVISINGIFWPVIIVNGMVTGLWKRVVKKNRVQVELSFFQKTFLRNNSAVKPALEAAMERVKVFFEGVDER